MFHRVPSIALSALMVALFYLEEIKESDQLPVRVANQSVIIRCTYTYIMSTYTKFPFCDFSLHEVMIFHVYGMRNTHTSSSITFFLEHDKSFLEILLIFSQIASATVICHFGFFGSREI